MHNYIYLKHQPDRLAQRIARDHDPRPVCNKPAAMELETADMAVVYHSEEDGEDEEDNQLGYEDSATASDSKSEPEPIIEYRHQPSTSSLNKMTAAQPAASTAAPGSGVSKRAKTVLKDGKLRKLKPRSAAAKQQQPTPSPAADNNASSSTH